MGKKYIIELEDEPFGRNDDPNIPHGMDELWRVAGFNSLVFDKNGLERLEPLENVVVGIEAKAYQRGYENGFAEGRTRAVLSARQEIRIGDEVEYDVPYKSRFVVFCIEEQGETVMCGGYGLSADCNVMDGWDYSDVEHVRKTGRHFDQVEKFVKAVEDIL